MGALALYKRMVGSGVLRVDAQQVSVMRLLQVVHEQLEGTKLRPKPPPVERAAEASAARVSERACSACYYGAFFSLA